MVSTKKVPTILVGQETPSIFGHRYIVVEGRGCAHCDLCRGGHDCHAQVNKIGYCGANKRADKKEIIFKRKGANYGA